MGADRHRVERRQQPRHVLLPLSGPAHTGLACANRNPRVPHLALIRRRPAAAANPRVRPRPRTAGDDRRVLPHGADAARSVRGARPRELREDLGLERPAALRPAQHQGHYVETKVVSKGLAQVFEEKHPDLTVHKQLKELRTGRVLIDWSQNDQYKTTVNVYSLRARARPTVSTPVSWDEVEKCLKAKDPSLLVFDSEQVLKRVEKHGDLSDPGI